jgi:hypothetical protein
MNLPPSKQLRQLPAHPATWKGASDIADLGARQANVGATAVLLVTDQLATKLLLQCRKEPLHVVPGHVDLLFACFKAGHILVLVAEFIENHLVPAALHGDAVGPALRPHLLKQHGQVIGGKGHPGQRIEVFPAGT